MKKACNIGIWRWEAGRSQVQHQPLLHVKLLLNGVQLNGRATHVHGLGLISSPTQNKPSEYF